MAIPRTVSRPIYVLLILMILAVFPSTTAGQVELGQPEASFPEDFGTIQTVRELPDGRVLVADPLSKALYAVDLDAGTRQVIGREGQGPEEYRQPDAAWALPGDSTLLVDLGNGRLVALGPDLEFGPTMPITVGDLQPGQPLILALPQGVDGAGNLYARSLGGMGGGPTPDSTEILRIDRATRTSQPVARFKIRDMTERRSGGANNQEVSLSPVPLSPEDAWGVAADGSIILARASTYQIERVAPNGSATKGPAIPFDPVRIGTAEKEEYVAELGRAGGGIRVGMEVVNGAASMAFARGGGGTNREIDQYTWPEVKPSVYSGRIPVDLLGRAWVRRHVEAGEPSTYDVFDEAGERVATVLLGHGKRILGFGEKGIYVVSFDEFDLNYLERYATPVL